MHVVSRDCDDRRTVTQLVARLRTNDWVTRESLFSSKHHDLEVLDATIDILLWSGVIRQSDDGDSPTTKYQWIK